MRTYLDHNATSPLRPGVKTAMIAAMDQCGNPSSIHEEGRAARRIVDDAREKLAFMLGCLPQMLTFTSGGTEANAMAIRCAGAQRILVSSVEHPSVLETAKNSGKTFEIIPVDGQGQVRLEALETLLAKLVPNTLVSVMLANNETGVIQPIADVVALARSKGALVHVDAVQAVGKLHVNFGLLGVDMMTVAAHKVGGPKGVGALIIRDGLAVEPLFAGGGQELRRRSGTENVMGLAGFGALANEPLIGTHDLIDKLHETLADCVIFGDRVERLSNTVCFARPGMIAETLLINLDLEGIAVSSGSACSSGKVSRSHVLEAMGVSPERAHGAIRVSLGWNTTAADIARFTEIWTKLVARHRAKQAA